MTNKIKESFEASIRVLNESKNLEPNIMKASQLIINSLQTGNKILIFGNGGSAADSQHFAAELIGRYMVDRKSLPAISLTTDTSNITAIGNDFSFDNIFSRQCDSLVKPNDVVLGISTSGKSKNVLNGILASKTNGAKTIGLLGNNGGEIKNHVDLSIIVPSDNTPRIQESHRLILHIICDLIEENFV